MTDPFFTTGNNTGNNQGAEVQPGAQPNSTDNTQNSIDKLMSQQEQIQSKYKELKELLQNPELTDNQKDEIHEQMQKLSDLYSKNKESIAALSTNISGEKEIHVDKNVNTDNSKSKNFSFKKFMIGCVILLILFLGGLVGVFYSLINNPNRLQNFGIDGCTAVNLLQLFSVIFFGLLFIAGLGLFLVNLNRTIVSKNKRKAPFFLGAILSFIMMIIVAFFLIKMLNTLSGFSDTCGDLGNNQLVNAHAVVKNSKFKNIEIPMSENPPLVAPINVGFTLNSIAYKNDVVTKLGSVNVINIMLDCGNGQKIQLGGDNSRFSNTCFYTQKGSYPTTFIVNYTDAVGTPQTYEVPAQYINIGSEVTVASENFSIETLNSALLVGKNPVNLKIDSSSVFKDYNLLYDVKRSAECNLERNDEKSVEFQSRYTKEGVYDVCVYFPGLSENIYTFPIRVEQGEVTSGFDVKYLVSMNTSNNSYENPDSIQVTQIPTTLTIQILSIKPDTKSTQKRLLKNGETQPALFSDPNTFKVTIDEDGDQELVLELSDSEQQLNTKKTIKVSVNQASVIGALSVSPETVGTSPFTVRLDASTTTLNDPNDEIVYFSWDFGDGVKNSNTSDAIVSHTYEYDFTNENGVFYPSVTMRTKNGLTFTVSGTIISVKKPDTNISISLDEHPAQLASIGENVPMSISFDGVPKKIYRDFGDGDTQECDGRSCAETLHSYVSEGTYTIKATVEFEDKPTIEGYINLQIR